MSGHSKWATTHRQKEAADAKKGAAFTKLANLITLAAKQGGGDTESNFKLRLAVEKARAANMPKDNIDRAIKKGTGEAGDGKVFEEVTYEILGPEGSKFIAEAITDNKNRTVSDLKTTLNKNGAQLGSLNSVSWLFDRKGFIIIEKNQLAGKNPDELELSIIDTGTEDIIQEADFWDIRTAPESLGLVIKNLKNLGLEPKESGLAYFAKEDLVVADSEILAKIERIYNLIEELDDINNVYTNVSW
ncbi:MAG: YebC/PmpR family DNA-binding transcriptional regulator [Patescibacteria group bacterium]